MDIDDDDDDDNDVSADIAAPPKESLLHDGYTARLAKNKTFEAITLCVISVNSLWIGVDLESNDADQWPDAPFIFQLADNSFCAFFSFEVVVRFLAFRRKVDFLRDRSCRFDTALVALMVFETWILVIVSRLFDSDNLGGGLSRFSILRLLRLLRLTRMVRLMRAFPEFLSLIKGMFIAMRAVTVMFMLILGLCWVFGIIFTLEYKDRSSRSTTDFEVLHDVYFGRLGKAMVALFVQGTLLDEVTTLCMHLRDDSPFMMIILFFFMTISSLMSMNMLIGVIGEVIIQTSQTQMDELTVAYAISQLQEIFEVTDGDGSGTVGAREFLSMIRDPKSKRTLLDLGIRETQLNDLAKHLFEDEHIDLDQLAPRRTIGFHTRDMNFNEFVDELLSLRPKQSMSLHEVLALKRLRCVMHNSTEAELQNVAQDMYNMVSNAEQKAEIGDAVTDISHGEANVELMRPLPPLPGEPTGPLKEPPMLMGAVEVTPRSTCQTLAIGQTPSMEQKAEIGDAVTDISPGEANVELMRPLPPLPGQPTGPLKEPPMLIGAVEVTPRSTCQTLAIGQTPSMERAVDVPPLSIDRKPGETRNDGELRDVPTAMLLREVRKRLAKK